MMTTEEGAWPGRCGYATGRARPWTGSGPVLGSSAVDVVIVGAGMAGIATALALLQRGVRSIALVESEAPGAGASGRNGGFVFAGYSLANDRLIRQLGSERAACMHGWTRDSVGNIRRRIDELGIACSVNDAGVVLADWFADDQSLRNFADRMQSELSFRLEYLEPDALKKQVNSERYGAGLFEPGSFHFNPLQHALGLADYLVSQGVQVHEQSPVREIVRVSRHGEAAWLVKCERGSISAAQVVLTTGGYDRRLRPDVQRALQPIATYIALTEPLGERLARYLPRPVAVYDTRFAFDYFRPLPDSRLLWGGRISIASRSPSAIRRLLARDLARVFPGLAGVRFEHAWGGWMSYARHEMPLLGQSADGLWFGLAFGGHGMATTNLAGEVLAEALCGQRERLDAFTSWQPVWAGGGLGRAAVQGRYWCLQGLDWWREHRLSARKKH